MSASAIFSRISSRILAKDLLISRFQPLRMDVSAVIVHIVPNVTSRSEIQYISPRYISISIIDVDYHRTIPDAAR